MHIKLFGESVALGDVERATVFEFFHFDTPVIGIAGAFAHSPDNHYVVVLTDHEIPMVDAKTVGLKTFVFRYPQASFNIKGRPEIPHAAPISPGTVCVVGNNVYLRNGARLYINLHTGVMTESVEPGPVSCFGSWTIACDQSDKSPKLVEFGSSGD